jgi:hypothetical protein
VDDVVTFPGRMYAFVNYRSTEEALLAYASLQDQQVPELTGELWKAGCDGLFFVVCFTEKRLSALSVPAHALCNR